MNTSTGKIRRGRITTAAFRKSVKVGDVVTYTWEVDSYVRHYIVVEIRDADQSPLPKLGRTLLLEDVQRRRIIVRDLGSTTARLTAAAPRVLVPVIANGHYEPSQRGSKSLKDSKPLYIGNDQVTIEVTESDGVQTVAYFVGTKLLAEGPMPAKIRNYPTFYAWVHEIADSYDA